MTSLYKNEDVAEQIVVRMQAISVATGYETDIGLKVFRGRRKIDDDSVPCSVLVEGEDTVRSQAGRTTQIEISQRYVLVGYAPCDPDNPNVVGHQIIRDFKKAIFTTNGLPDATMGRNVRGVIYHGRDIGPRADGVAIVMATIEFSVDFAEDLANP